MEQIQRAQIAGELDNVHVAGGAREHGDAVDVCTSEMQPEVGDGGARLGGVRGTLVGVDEVLPAGGAIGGDNTGERLRRVEGGLRIVVAVDCDAMDGGVGVGGVHPVGF